MDTYWVCGVSHSGQFGNWAFAEFRDVYESGTDFGRLVAETSGKLVVDRG